MGIGDQKRNGRIVIGFDLPVFWVLTVCYQGF